MMWSNNWIIQRLHTSLQKRTMAAQMMYHSTGFVHRIIKESLVSPRNNRLTTAATGATAAVCRAWISELRGTWTEFKNRSARLTWQSRWSPRDLCSCRRVVCRRAAPAGPSSSARSHGPSCSRFSHTRRAAADIEPSDSFTSKVKGKGSGFI